MTEESEAMLKKHDKLTKKYNKLRERIKTFVPDSKVCAQCARFTICASEGIYEYCGHYTEEIGFPILYLERYMWLLRRTFHGVYHMSTISDAMYTEKCMTLRLYCKDLVRFFPDGKIYVNTNNCITPLLKNILKAYAPVKLKTLKGKHYVTNRKGEWIPYYDGIII